MDGGRPTDPVAEAYSAWLRAASAAAGGHAALGRKVAAAGRERLTRARTEAERAGDRVLAARLGAELDSWAARSFPSNTVSGWLGNAMWLHGQIGGRPPSAPADLLDAIIAAVHALVPAPPPGASEWPSFTDLATVYAARQDRREGDGAARGTATIKGKAAAHAAADLAALLRFAPGQRAWQLDPLELTLGSWLTEGMLPSYVPRDADQQLRAALADPARRLVVITGPPKSGKTRALVEVLHHNPAARDQRVWWPFPHPEAITAIIDHAGSDADPAGVVVVIDDLQEYRPGQLAGITSASLERLVATGVRVVATVHTSIVDSLTARSIDHRADPSGLLLDTSTGADTRLGGLLRQNAIAYTAELTAAEQTHIPADLRAAADRHRIAPNSMRRLAEVLAAVDQLHAQCEKQIGANDPTVNGSLIRAAVDATHLYPQGCTREQLAQLTEWAHSRRAPTRLWDPTSYENALYWATTPIGGEGSPHAILQPNSATTLRLFDALLPRLQPHPWTPTHLDCHRQDLTASAQFQAGTALSRQDGDREQARTWWRAAADAGHPVAMFNLGVLAYDEGDREQARTWWRAAADAGEPDAIFNLGALAYDEGDREQARTWWSASADAGHPGAMLTLGVLAEQDGDPEQARTWWRAAADAGHPGAIFNLGVLAEQDRDREQARTWWRAAADAGHPDAMFDLGVLAEQDGDPEQARTWWRAAADAGHPDAMFNLGLLANEDGDPEQARTWWRAAADAGHPGAMLDLGALAEQDGDPEQTRAWWSAAADAGLPDAMFDLGLLANEDGDPEQARTWWRAAADAGHPGAMFNLGLLANEDGDPEQAHSWWTRAADAGHPGAAAAGIADAIEHLQALDEDEPDEEADE